MNHENIFYALYTIQDKNEKSIMFHKLYFQSSIDLTCNIASIGSFKKHNKNPIKATLIKGFAL